MPVFPLPFRQKPATRSLAIALETTTRPTFMFPLKTRSRDGWHHPELRRGPWLSHPVETVLPTPEALSLDLALKQPGNRPVELTLPCLAGGSCLLALPWPVSHAVPTTGLLPKTQSVPPESLTTSLQAVAVARFSARERPLHPTRWSAVTHPYPVERLASPVTRPLAVALPAFSSHQATTSAKRAPLVRQSLAVHRLKRLLQAEIKSTLAKRNDTSATNILLHRVYDRINVSLFDRLEVNEHWQLEGHWAAEVDATKAAESQWLVVFRLKDEATADWKQAMLPAPEDMTRVASKA